MKPLRRRLTFANVMSSIAVFLVVAGGTAFAATELGKESVGTKQLKKEAVSLAKINKAAKKSLKGATGATGPAGAKGGTGATGPQGPAGKEGKEGPPGTNLTATTPLASGITETGVFAAAGGGPGSAAGALMTATANFVQPLSAPLDGAHVIYLKAGVASAVHCPGVGHADPGYFCAYAGYEQGAEIYTSFEDPQTGSGGAGRDGTNAYGKTTAAGSGDVAGTWAVTAP
jgi:hypothetical protein